MARENPCLPMDVCLIIGEPFSSLVLEHHPQHARRISQKEAVEILEAEDLRGHVHHAFFKQAMIGRFYAICNCCSCCCGALQAFQSGTPMLASSGYHSQINKEICIECGICLEICNFNAIDRRDGTILVDKNQCMGCGICETHCPQRAIQLIQHINGIDPLFVKSN